MSTIKCSEYVYSLLDDLYKSIKDIEEIDTVLTLLELEKQDPRLRQLRIYLSDLTKKVRRSYALARAVLNCVYSDS